MCCRVLCGLFSGNFCVSATVKAHYMCRHVSDGFEMDE